MLPQYKKKTYRKKYHLNNAKEAETFKDILKSQISIDSFVDCE